MDKISLLIVEDEPLLAELHAEFIQRDNSYSIVGIASTCHDAKVMLEHFKPELVLLDKYLPDGFGTELLEYIIDNKLPTYAIFITAASDIETCSWAIRHGAFDFLIKPIVYERLKHTLTRFKLFLKRQNQTKQLNQRRVDELFNLQTKDFTEIQHHNKGIEPLTLQKIQDVFLNDSSIQSVDSIVQITGVSRTTTRRYLEYLVQTKFLVIDIQYGRVGRPERYYRKAI